MPIYFLNMSYSSQGSPFINPKADLFPRMVMQVVEPLSLLLTALDAVCWIAGGAFLFGAVERYMQHRYNPSQSPMSQVISLGTLGTVLILLPVIGQYALPHQGLV